MTCIVLVFLFSAYWSIIALIYVYPKVYVYNLINFLSYCIFNNRMTEHTDLQYIGNPITLPGRVLLAYM